MWLLKLLLVSVCMLGIGKMAYADAANTRKLTKLEPLSQKVVINTEQMDLNKLLNVIRNNTETQVILAPEFSGVNDLKKVIALPKGMITLRELLDIICIQLEAKWIASGENGNIVINPMQNTIIAEREEDSEKSDLYTVEYAGKSLRKVLKDLHRRSGASITMFGDVGSIRVEIIMADATVEDILRHIASVYNLRLSFTDEGIYRIGRETE